MSNSLLSAGDVTLALQNRVALPDTRGRNGMPASTPALAKTGSEKHAPDDAAAREAANKFEALLIHNMLKSMRKTTMSEDKSNDRAIYDDMFDEKLADTMIQAGGIGIADRIVAQIREQQGRSIEPKETSGDIQRLRELASHIPRPETSATRTAKHSESVASNSGAIKHYELQMASALWSNERSESLSDRQQAFVQPLVPHAIRNARKLGTSPNTILAVAALETGWGRSMIKDKSGNDSHNLFGIKATGSDNRYATTLTTEYIEGSPQKQKARFKTFDSKADAVDGFANFILSNPRYSKALEHAGDPERFLQELQNAGYATDPRYAEKAISIMRQIAGNSLPL